MSHFKSAANRRIATAVSARLSWTAIFFVVVAAGCSGISDPGPWDNAHDPVSEYFVPAAPTVILEEASAHAIVVHWVRNSRFDVTCEIYRKKPDAAYVKLGSRPADSLSFVDSLDVDTSLRYFYKISTSSANGALSYSKEVEFTPGQKPGVPVLVTLRKMAGGSWVYLEWTYTSPIGDEFIIERAHDGGSFSEIGRTSISITSFADNWPVQTGTSSYRIRVARTGWLSASSNIMTL